MKNATLFTDEQRNVARAAPDSSKARLSDNRHLYPCGDPTCERCNERAADENEFQG